MQMRAKIRGKFTFLGKLNVNKLAWKIFTLELPLTAFRTQTKHSYRNLFPKLSPKSKTNSSNFSIEKLLKFLLLSPNIH